MSGYNGVQWGDLSRYNAGIGKVILSLARRMADDQKDESIYEDAVEGLLRTGLNRYELGLVPPSPPTINGVPVTLTFTKNGIEIGRIGEGGSDGVQI